MLSVTLSGERQIAPACYTKNAEQKRNAAPNHQLGKDELTLPRQSEQTSASEDEYDLYTVDAVDKHTDDPFLAVLTINGQPIEMEIDTGCTLNLISESVYKTVWNEDSRQ